MRIRPLKNMALWPLDAKVRGSKGQQFAVSPFGWSNPTLRMQAKTGEVQKQPRVRERRGRERRLQFGYPSLFPALWQHQREAPLPSGESTTLQKTYHPQPAIRALPKCGLLHRRAIHPVLIVHLHGMLTQSHTRLTTSGICTCEKYQ